MKLFGLSRIFSCSACTPKGVTARWREPGMSLLETVVVLFVLGTIIVTFLTGVTISSKAAYTVDEQATAVSLAQTQMELIQAASYDAAGAYPAVESSSTDYVNYSADFTVETLNTGLQKITVIVSHSGASVFTLEGYKVQR